MSEEQIQAAIQKLRDSSDDLEKCVDLLYKLQRDSGPVAETVVALKYQRPNLHKLLKFRLRHNPGLRLVLDL